HLVALAVVVRAALHAHQAVVAPVLRPLVAVAVAAQQVLDADTGLDGHHLGAVVLLRDRHGVLPGRLAVYVDGELARLGLGRTRRRPPDDRAAGDHCPDHPPSPLCHSASPLFAQPRPARSRNGPSFGWKGGTIAERPPRTRRSRRSA